MTPAHASPSRGRTFVYMLPCRDEDILKIGFSRDPLQRMRTLHRRFFEFFDLDRALLLDTEYLRDARRIERALITRFADFRAPAPLVARQAAAGRTEWFRGVAPEAEALLRRIASEEGFVLHAPASAWLRVRFMQASDVLYGWSERMLEAATYLHFNPSPSPGAHDESVMSALRVALDTWAALGMNVQALVPPAVYAWYRYGELPSGR